MTEHIDQHIVLIYSDDQRVREHLRLLIGQRPAEDIHVTFVEAATSAEVIRTVESVEVDLVILDGEAAPAGGLGIARQLKDEIEFCPPTLVIIARPADRWLAAYAKVDATVTHPLDPVVTIRTVVDLLTREWAVPVAREY